MEFTDIAMELSRRPGRLPFQHPHFTVTKGKFRSFHFFRYYLIQDAYYLNAFSKAYDHLAEKTSKQRNEETLKQNAQSLVEGELFIRQQFSRAGD